MHDANIAAQVTVVYTVPDVITESQLDTLGMTLDELVRMMIDEEGGPLYGPGDISESAEVMRVERIR